jgi:murein DD-endopeptidase MepM/ murein hydrolase activator NlpD
MPAWAIKIGLQIAQDPDKAIKFMFIGLMIVVVLFMALTLPFFFLFLPATEPEKYDEYKQAAIRIANDTQGQMINWQEMIALDAFLLKQDFTQSNPSHIYSFFKDAFIWKEEIRRSYDCSYTDENGNEVQSSCTETVIVYHKRSLDEVMDRLSLSDDDKENVRNYLVINLDDMDDLGPQDPTDIPPGNYTPVLNIFTWPCDVYRLTSGFGGRVDPVTGIPGENHGGIDIGAPNGTEVRATMSGVVIFSQYTDSGGNIVAIDHQNGYVTRYLHLSQLLVAVGDEVNQNDAIALSGNTGRRTTGAHLHYEIHENGVKKDPLLFYQ